MKSYFWTSLSMLIGLVLATSSGAAVVYVDQGGSGDYLDLAVALMNVVDGDEIRVMPGTYHGPMFVEDSVEIIADSGLGTVVLDGEDATFLVKVEDSVSVTFSQLEFANGWSPGGNGFGSGLYAANGAVVSIENCHFHHNSAGWDGGAVAARDLGTVVTITDCLFEQNTASHNAGACAALLDARLNIYDSLFIENSTAGICGAVATWYADLHVEECLFLRNSGVDVGAIRALYGYVQVRNNTIHDNTGEYSVHIAGVAAAEFKKNIVTMNDTGMLAFLSSEVVRSLNIYQSAGLGLVVGGLVGLEYDIDPLFCNHLADDFMLCSLSFALPENNGQHLIGAYGQGCLDCGPVENEYRSLGSIKNLFR